MRKEKREREKRKRKTDDKSLWTQSLPSTSERSDVLQRSGLGGGSSDNDGVLHGVVLLEGLDQLGDSRSLLTDSDVDAVELLRLVVGVVPSLLVENGIQSDGSLSGLTVTNDQLTLTTANGNHSIDGLETSLHGLVDGSSRQDTGSLELRTALLLGVEGTLAVDRVTESVDDTSEQLGADRDINLLMISNTVQSISDSHKLNSQFLRYA